MALGLSQKSKGEPPKQMLFFHFPLKTNPKTVSPGKRKTSQPSKMEVVGLLQNGRGLEALAKVVCREEQERVSCKFKADRLPLPLSILQKFTVFSPTRLRPQGIGVLPLNNPPPPPSFGGEFSPALLTPVGPNGMEELQQLLQRQLDTEREQQQIHDRQQADGRARGERGFSKPIWMDSRSGTKG